MRFAVSAWRLVSTRDGRAYLFSDMPSQTWATNHLWLEWLVRLRCRIQGHPRGEIFYNAGGLEPDHRCETCGENIG